MSIKKSKEALTKQHDEIMKAVKSGKNLSVHLVRVMLNLKTTSDSAGRHWSYRDF